MPPNDILILDKAIITFYMPSKDNSLSECH